MKTINHHIIDNTTKIINEFLFLILPNFLKTRENKKDFLGRENFQKFSSETSLNKEIKMIVVDTEFTSLNFKGGLWQIGALELENPANTFLEEARLEEEDEIQQAALDVVEKTEDELKEKSRQSQKEMLEHFFNWVRKIRFKSFAAHGQWDFPYILLKAYKFGLEFPFPHRTFDLHSIAQLKHFEVKGNFLIKEDKSAMGLDSVLEFCGIKDERRRIGRKGEVLKEGKAHNALEDCKLEAECFSRLIYGKGLFPEYAEFPVPDYLKKIKLE